MDERQLAVDAARLRAHASLKQVRTTHWVDVLVDEKAESGPLRLLKLLAHNVSRLLARRRLLCVYFLLPAPPGQR